MTPALVQIAQMLVMVALAPFLTGLVRWVKARLQGRRGPDLVQPYRDLKRLFRKEAVVADDASWLFRVSPYVSFTAIWLAAGLVPTFSTNLALGATADLIALAALLGTARFFTVLAGLDVGTSFGGIGASREMMIASLAEPAMLMAVFTVALVARTTSLAGIAEFVVAERIGLQVSMALALVALVLVAIAETGRIPIDNPATHLELTMVHEAMVLEYSGRHLALIEAGAMLKLLLYMALIACIFAPWGIGLPESGPAALGLALVAFVAKMGVGALLLALFETSIAKMRVFRYADFLGGALLFGLLGTLFFYVKEVL